jgi:hypothetical protein
MKINKWFYIFIAFLLISSCNQEKSMNGTSSEFKISLSKDSTELILSNIPLYMMDEFREDSLDNDLWTNFFAVYRDTSDQEMRDFQPPIKGNYNLLDSSISFKPELDWALNEDYFARCYTKILLRAPADILSSRKVNTNEGYIEFKFSAKK